MLYNKKFIF